jgi:hypothetical protein
VMELQKGFVLGRKRALWRHFLLSRLLGYPQQIPTWPETTLDLTQNIPDINPPFEGMRHLFWGYGARRRFPVAQGDHNSG